MGARRVPSRLIPSNVEPQFLRGPLRAQALTRGFLKLFFDKICGYSAERSAVTAAQLVPLLMSEIRDRRSAAD